jgi:hypothetical protein
MGYGFETKRSQETELSCASIRVVTALNSYP